MTRIAITYDMDEHASNDSVRRFSRLDILEAECESRRDDVSRNKCLLQVLQKVKACTDMKSFEEVRREVAELLGDERNEVVCSGQQRQSYDAGYSRALEAPAGEANRVDADLLIPGRGEPVHDASLVYEGKTILYAGARAALPSKWRGLDATRVPVLMPGMWDCHTHFMGSNSFDFSQVALQSPALAGAREARSLAAIINAGFTSVREVGGYAIDISTAISEGWLQGPNIYGCGAALSMTAGHGDLHQLPLSLVKNYSASPYPVLKVCDGVEECVKAVREQIRRGAQAIKIHVTGGVLSLIDSPQAAQFSPVELAAMVDEASRAGISVGTHAHGKTGILAALRAGVRSIEHGSYLDEECAEVMLEKGALFCATRTIVEYGLEHLEELPEPNRPKLVAVAKRGEEAYALAVKKGVKIALGTDIGVASPKIGLVHGTNGIEFSYAVKAGLSPLQAIEAGTANAVEVLGARAPKSGQLKNGYDADFIALSANPLEDIKVLSKAANVTHVWKAGKIEKAPGRPVGLLPL